MAVPLVSDELWAVVGLWCSMILDANIIVAASVIAPAIGCGVATYR